VALEHELARLEPDDRRRARAMMRVAAPVRPLVAVTDEHHVDRRDALQHLVRTDRVERGEFGEESDRSDERSLAGELVGACVGHVVSFRDAAGDALAGALGVRRKRLR
jgi:hypothetical protein